MDFNPLTTTAVELQDLLKSRKTSSVDLVGAYLRQIEKYEPQLNAIVSQSPRSYLLDVARVLDQERTSGKDNMATDVAMQVDTTAGSLALVGFRPKRNANVVDMLLKSGAIIISKANLSELNFFKGSALDCGWSAVGGQTQSAYVKGGYRKGDSFAGHSNPAGSSARSAVGVSAGYALASLGTETEGSLIIPASRAALYTIKPTIAIVPQEGIIPITSLFDSAGPMTKTVMDLAVLLDVIADETRTSGKPAGGYVTKVTRKWEGLSIGALDPDKWRFPTFARRSEPAAEKQTFDETYEAYERLKVLVPTFFENVDLISDEEFKFNGEHVIPTLCADDFGTQFGAYLCDVENSTVAGVDELIKFNEDHAEKELPSCNPRPDFLTGAAKSNLTKQQRDEIIAYMRDVGRTKGLDALFHKLNINILIAPAESAMTQFEAATGYPIASLPLG